jgi:hypothetical protein
VRCPRCGTWSDVLSTRPLFWGFVVDRARNCANGHRFHTYEVARPPKRAGRKPAGYSPLTETVALFDPTCYAAEIVQTLADSGQARKCTPL